MLLYKYIYMWIISFQGGKMKRKYEIITSILVVIIIRSLIFAGEGSLKKVIYLIGIIQ